VYKVNDNQASNARRDADDYDPAHKYMMPWTVLVHNINRLTQRAAQDQCVDEYTVGHSGE
jgi:hypothetical protein